MKQQLIILGIAVTALFYTCKPKDATPQKAENALDAGREFIKASLEGNRNRAYFYMLKDSVNENLLDRWEESFRKLPRDDREAFRNANIWIRSQEDLNDSVSIIHFSNSYKNQPQVLKVLKNDSEWLVDFKYTFTEGEQ